MFFFLPAHLWRVVKVVKASHTFNISQRWNQMWQKDLTSNVWHTSKVKSNYDERHGIDQVQRALTRNKKGLIALQSILLFMKATLRKKNHCLKKRVCSQGSGPKFVWVRDVASISIWFTRNRSCTGSHRKKQLNRGNELACECRRISRCRFSPPKNNVCEPEPQSHFSDLPPMRAKLQSNGDSCQL